MDDLPVGSGLCASRDAREKSYLTNTKILHFRKKNALIFEKDKNSLTT